MSRGRGGRRRWGDNGFEAWGGYMAAKKAKLEDQYSEKAKAEQDLQDNEVGIFHGVAIFVNGYTDPTSDDLKRLMMQHGGTFHHYFSSRKTTHIIATNLPDSKVKALKGTEPICHPSWITDSIKEGKLLDYTNYLLYSRQSKTQPKLAFQAVAESKAEAGGRAKDASDVAFIGEFYNNSRLHHIATMGANFKRHVNVLRENHDGQFPAREQLVQPGTSSSSGMQKQTIMHIDMDCFFVSVALRKRPDLVGKPVAVAHAKGANRNVTPEIAEARKKEMDLYRARYAPSAATADEERKAADSVEYSSMSELASVSYEARASGVKNGMFLGSALKLCPELKTLPYDFEGYNEVAKVLYDTVAQYTLEIQAVSCDELLVDITDVLSSTGIPPLEFAEKLRQDIFRKTQCCASVGLGPTLLLARMATRKAKPNGAFFLRQEDAKDFLKSVSVRDLPGVGRKVGHKLKEWGVASCEDLLNVPLSRLQDEFGHKNGLSMYRYAQGIDDRSINLCQERKSVSAEINYGIRFKSDAECDSFMSQLCSELVTRMEKLAVRGRTITLKLMMRAEDAPKETSKFLGHGICTNVSKSSTLSMPTAEKDIIKREVDLLLRQLKLDHADMRGIGIQVSKLTGNTTGTYSEPGPSAAAGTRSILNFVRKDVVTETTKRNIDQSVDEKAQLSFSQLDPAFLEAMPEDIREELKATYSKATKRSLPSGSEKETTEKSGSAASLKAGVAGITDLSFSQLDQEVLAAIPEDIRNELRETCSRKHRENSASSLSTTSKETSLSSLSLSSIDPEVLAALPEDVREEVQQEYGKKKQLRANIFDRLMHPASTTPEKQVTPVKRRGRPPKNSPRFVKRSGKAQVSNQVAKTLFPTREEHQTMTEQSEEAPIVAVCDEERIPPPQKEASLQGKTSVEDVKEQLKAWMSSCETPVDDDVDTFAKFLHDVVTGRQLMKVRVLLKTFLRYALTLSEEWAQAYDNILEKVQIAMIKTYGNKLNPTSLE